ncbi:hypothetical protein H6P81_018502 [Aristolochia fimbriata]|uniref:Uncharacterized protein n=1 Tax=Aristolochia fimbriata TaxID=158543 RepID=A0AAV7E249_ARIFI|nr:hypothetical protein H6P81_018502 [Aristolochia fimbriata]
MTSKGSVRRFTPESLSPRTRKSTAAAAAATRNRGAVDALASVSIIPIQTNQRRELVIQGHESPARLHPLENSEYQPDHITKQENRSPLLKPHRPRSQILHVSSLSPSSSWTLPNQSLSSSVCRHPAPSLIPPSISPVKKIFSFSSISLLNNSSQTVQSSPPHLISLSLSHSFSLFLPLALYLLCMFRGWIRS